MSPEESSDKLENETSKCNDRLQETPTVNQATHIVGWGDDCMDAGGRAIAEERTPTNSHASVGVRALTPTYTADWPFVRLGDHITDVVDNRGKTPPLSTTGYELIETTSIVGDNKYPDFGKITKFVDEDTYKNWFRKGHPVKGDLLVATVGLNIGNVSIQNEDRGCVAQNLVALRPNGLALDADFLYYFLTLNSTQHILKSLNIGSAQPSLKVPHLLNIQLHLPDIEVQKNIGLILGRLDEKIELNRQTNQTLEQIAQAIFKSWFVDFEPVKAKVTALSSLSPQDRAGERGQELAEQAAICAISGKTPLQLAQLDPQTLQQLKATAALFPDALVDSELGEIPEGWEVKGLDQIANYLNGLALQKFRPKDETNFLPVLKIAQLKAGVAVSDEKASPDIKPEYIVDNGDVVFSWSGSLVVDVWCGGKAALNQHLFKVTSDSFPKWFFYYFTKHHLDDFQRIAAAKAVTMGHIKREHLSTALCAFNKAIIENCDAYFSALLDQQIALRLQNTNLAELRDSLLPKLLSGELSISPESSTLPEAL